MPFRLSRRQIIVRNGVGRRAAERHVGTALRQAQKRIIVPEGEFAPLPIAIPNFVAGTPGDAEVGVGVTQVITNNLKRSGLFAPIDQAAYHREDHQHRRRAAIPELEDHQRAGAGDRPHDAAGRRPPEGRIPPLGRRHRPAAHRPAIFHLAGILAADRAHHLRPDLRAPDRRERLFRQPRGVRRRDRVRRSAASSGWR